MISVLIVEDDPMVAELNKNYLSMTDGFLFTGWAADGEQALQMLAENPASLVLLDVFMPKLSGFELLTQIRSRHPQTDVIMVTTAKNSEDIQTALRLGISDYIVKPFTFERFQIALNNYKERVRLLTAKKTIDQELLDKRIFVRERTLTELPKGIDKETLKMIREALYQHDKSFSVKDIVPKISLSRISLKKYLDYMIQTGELQSYLSYSQIGRPATMYFLCPNKK